jgi:hypothetical protein
MADSTQGNSDHAKALGSLGASKGGRARANVLTAEQRSEIAREAVRRRWIKAGKAKAIEPGSTPEDEDAEQTVETAPDRPYSMFRGTLKIADVELECHVLSNGMRVFTQREVVRALSGGRDSSNLQRYLARNPLTADKFELGPTIQFDVREGKKIANGFNATALLEICELYLKARDENLLKKSQAPLAWQAEIIVRACAKVGIIALIDEATGYQEVRKKRELQLKLQAFIAEDIQDWARMFPEEFWLQLARLEGVRYSPRNRPLRWGKYVMMFVYDAIDKDVGNELRKRNPNPRFLKNHHQWLQKFGREQVHDQIERVVTIMKLCDDMDDFRAKFAKVFKKTEDQMTFDFGV